MTDVAETDFEHLAPPKITVDPAPPRPVLPDNFTATVLLHPYSPPPLSGDDGSTPFFQLCVATVSYSVGQAMSICVRGLKTGQSWWYYITPNGVSVQINQDGQWRPAGIAWTLPGTDWLGSQAVYFQTGFINWMEAQECQWWKQPVANSNATTWTWFDNATGLPFRMMFGAPPPTPTSADPNQLAFFQNFSFSYFPSFEGLSSPPVLDQWIEPQIDGLTDGNPYNWSLPTWSNHFAMTTLMTPVDSASFPLPTVVFYQWLDDPDYTVAEDRAQATIMSYEYNPQQGGSQVALLYGVAPSGTTPPPLAGKGFLYNQIVVLVRGAPDPIVYKCESMPLGAEPPNWASIPGVDGQIHATISNNAALSPGQYTAVISVTFPPSKEYPQGRYLWTWYSAASSSEGTVTRPVTFMESASTIAEGGTSLALADYFDYAVSPIPFPPSFFTCPALCLTQGADDPAGPRVNAPTALLAHGKSK